MSKDVHDPTTPSTTKAMKAATTPIRWTTHGAQRRSQPGLIPIRLQNNGRVEQSVLRRCPPVGLTARRPEGAGPVARPRRLTARRAQRGALDLVQVNSAVSVPRDTVPRACHTRVVPPDACRSSQTAAHVSYDGAAAATTMMTNHDPMGNSSARDQDAPLTRREPRRPGGQRRSPEGDPPRAFASFGTGTPGSPPRQARAPAPSSTVAPKVRLYVRKVR